MWTDNRSLQYVPELEHEGAWRDFGAVVQSEHGVQTHQGGAEEVQDSGDGGERKRGETKQAYCHKHFLYLLCEI